MNWDLFDFAVAAVLLAGVGITYAITVRLTGNTAYRSAVGVALAAAFLMVWVNGAVGIIGDEGNSANLMFGGVLMVAVAGVLIARFRPQGMARALVATALAQVTVAGVALSAGLGRAGPAWPQDILFLTGFFALLWLLSAWLFRKAAQAADKQGVGHGFRG